MLNTTLITLEMLILLGNLTKTKRLCWKVCLNVRDNWLDKTIPRLVDQREYENNYNNYNTCNIRIAVNCHATFYLCPGQTRSENNVESTKMIESYHSLATIIFFSFIFLKKFLTPHQYFYPSYAPAHYVCQKLNSNFSFSRAWQQK